MIYRGPLLNPRPGGSVDYYRDGALVGDRFGKIIWVGHFGDLPPQLATLPVRQSDGVLLPPFLDLHTHLPQHPIRGGFTKGIENDPEEGRLLAGLRRNVFPVEARCAEDDYAERLTRTFMDDTLSHGVVGGAAYGTVHASAVDAALRILPDFWSLGLVLMNVNCPEYLRTDETTLDQDITRLADAYGDRFIVTDRFAVSVTTPLRQRAVAAARRHGLRMQTHLNEQRAEKLLVEEMMYPGYDSYTDVYRRDGLLAHRPILAHCIQMTPPEWQMLSDADAVVAHCPTSNMLLGSGVMPLDGMPAGIPYAICTDVGASPTCSLLSEMAQFLRVHQGVSHRATPGEALYRTTLAPAQILGIADQVGTFEAGMPLSFIEVSLPEGLAVPHTAPSVILAMLRWNTEHPPHIQRSIDILRREGLPFGEALTLLTDEVWQTAHRLSDVVFQVVVKGQQLWQRPQRE